MRVSGGDWEFRPLLPAAVQVAADAHDTPLSMSTVPGLGLCATVHLVPFQDSMRVFSAPGPVSVPTVVQVVVEEHDTPWRLSYVDPGLGLVTRDQVVPSQDSMSALVMRRSPCVPTAVHAAADTHDTPSRTLLLGRFGLGTTDQAVPFQDSTRVRWV